MAVKVKPVQATEIKDKKIIEQVISEIHRQPTQKDMEYREKRREALQKTLAK